MHLRQRWTSTSAALLLLLIGAPVAAQTGNLTGRVVVAETGEALAGAQVEAIGPDGRAAGSAVTTSDGSYRIGGLPAGTYAISARMVGYSSGRVSGVQLAPGQTSSVATISLTSVAVQLNPVVISASRRPEKAIEAPAHVEVISEQEIQERPAPNISEHLRSAAGLSLITQGIGATNIAARGFNNIFSGSLHVITDNRIAAVPSLRVNSYAMVPVDQEDIGRIEVVLGPGSALYGPNTANGVVHMITRSPLDQQGTTVSIGAGERSILMGSFRTSQLVTPDFGVKLSGRYLQGEEWHHTDRVEAQARQQALTRDPNTRIGLRDYDLKQMAFDARADWRFAPDATAILSVGRTQLDGVEMTGIGASQVEDWAYTYYQGRLNWGRAFAQAYLNASDAGETWNLRDNLSIIDRSKLFVAQLQHGFDLGTRQTFTYGADFFRTMPETGGTIHGVNEDDDVLTEIGAYLQSETALHPKLDLVLAGRLDDHSELNDRVFSPRAGLVFKPTEMHNFRLTYNRAFSTPGALNYFLDINSGLVPGQLGQLGYGLRLQGNRGGWSFRDGNGNYTFRSPFTPAALGGRTATLPVQSTTLYQYAVGLLLAYRAIDPQTAQLLSQMNAAGVGLNTLSLLDPTNPRPLTDESVPDIAPLQESTNQTYEVGYKGIFGERLLLAADAWYSKVDNFISGVELSSSLLLLNGPQLEQMFVTQSGGRIPAVQAAALAAGIARIPLGVISPSNLSQSGTQTDVLLTYRNFGEVDYWGTDLSATALLTPRWTLGVVGSYTSDERFNTEGRNIYLNAPTTRLSTNLGYRNEDVGFNGDVRVRYTGDFAASSGVHVATKCVEPQSVIAEPCIDAYTLVDLVLGYRIPRTSGTSLQLSVTNLLDEDYRSFAGVPTIGRLALIRLRHEF